jgi:integrase
MLVPTKVTHTVRNRTTGRNRKITRYRAEAVTFEVEIAQKLSESSEYTSNGWKWNFITKDGKPAARIMKLFGQGSSEKAKATRWERDRKLDIKEWAASEKTRQRIEGNYGGYLTPDAVNTYLHEARRYHRNTYENKARYLRPFAERFKHKPLNEISRRLAEKYLDTQFPDKADRVENRKYNALRKELRSFFSWVVQKYKWDTNPVAFIPQRPTKMADRKVASKADIDRMLEVVEGQTRNLLATYWWTGGRKEQVFSLTWKDVDFNSMQLRFKSAKTKSGDIKDVYVPILPWLEPYLEDQETNYKHLSKDGSVFINLNPAHKNTPHYGRRYAYNSNLITRCCDAAEVERFSYHALRRGLATFLYDNGVDFEYIQAVLGHEDVDTTKRYVYSLRPHRLAREMITEKLNEVMKS